MSVDATKDITPPESPVEALYRECGPALLAYFERRHGSRQIAEDLLQETFAAALRRVESLAAKPSPRAWLYTVARNLSVDAYRRARPSVALPEDLPAEEAAAPDPRLDAMCRAIARLTPASREVLELRLAQELSYEEIARVLGIPVGTVRSRLHHAVQQLRATTARDASLMNQL